MNFRGTATVLLLAILTGCASSATPTSPGAHRSYEGAPPTIPHDLFAISCTECHASRSVAIEGLKASPPLPHGAEGAFANCKQCHAATTTGWLFRANHFEPLPPPRGGTREHPGAPPTIPHRVFMREDCNACHGETGSRAEFRTSHPERSNCRQCHVRTSGVGPGAQFPPTVSGTGS